MSPRVPAGLRGRLPAAAPGAGRWLVALPAWGPRCVEILLRATLPAVLQSCAFAEVEHELLIWTDEPERVEAAITPGVGRRIMVPPGPDGAFESMSNCHRQALRAAGVHDRVLLLTADMVVSLEAVASCEAYMSGGKHLICCVAMRATDDPAVAVPVGAPGRELLGWAWANRHRMTRECTWPDGRSYDVWRMYFEREGEVAARAFLPHPLAVTPRGRNIDFRPTIDVNLASSFPQHLTHVITQPEEGAAIELSPPDKEFMLAAPMAERYLRRGPSIPEFIRAVNPRHRMFWGKKVVIVGSGGDCGDEEVVKRVLG